MGDGFIRISISIISEEYKRVTVGLNDDLGLQNELAKLTIEP